MSDLTRQEISVLQGLSTPGKIQDFLDALPMNAEEDGDTCHSPRWVLRENKAHCIEGALLAALALYLRGEKPLLLDLKTKKTDQEHVVALSGRTVIGARLARRITRCFGIGIRSIGRSGSSLSRTSMNTSW